MRRLVTFSTVLLIPALASGMKIESQLIDPCACFDWASFDFEETLRLPDDTLRRNPRTAERIEAALASNLVATGLEQLEEGEPDFVVSYWVGSSAKSDARDRPYRVSRDWNRSAFLHDLVQEATLVVDFIDAASHSLVWRGRATDVIIPGESAHKTEPAVRRLIERFLKDRAALETAVRE